MQNWTDIATDKYGNVQSGVSITVKLNGSTATIYSDNGVTTKSNPITTDSNGQYSFYAANGIYTLWVSGSQVGTATLFDLANTTSNWPSSSTDGANWASRDATLFQQSPTGKLSIVGAVKSSLTPASYAPIGVSGFLLNDGTGSGWALYADIQHESTASWSGGLEVAAKNKGSNVTPTSYNRTGGVFGVWLAGGGDNTYGGNAANPSAAAIMVLKNAHTWNKGLVFRDTSLTGTDGTGTGEGIAVEMASGHSLRWLEPLGGVAARIRSDNVTADAGVLQLFNANVVRWYGVNSKSILGALHVASGVNGIEVVDAVTGSPPIIRAAGDDTNADLLLQGKGTGSVRFGTHAAIVSETVTGYITIKDTGGTTRKIAVVS